MKSVTQIAFTLILLLFAGPIATRGQAIRHKVILEISTGTWCPACPGAALGANDLVASGASVAVVEHHDRDVYEIPASHERLKFLGVAAYPTGFFDARTIFIGGGPDVSVIQQYQKHYDEAMAVPTPFDLRASWTQNGDSIDVTVDVDQLGFFGGRWLRLQAALTESHIQENWQNLSEINYVTRAMYNDQHGIPITTSEGGLTVSKTFSMAIDPNWVQEKMQLVVWLEDSAIRRIYNGTSFSLSTPAHPVDAAVSSIQIADGPFTCNAGIAPEVVIRNMGENDLTAATIVYQINGGMPAAFNWTGSVPYFEYAKVALPYIPYNSRSNNVLSVSIHVPGDDDLDNDALTKTWKAVRKYQAGIYTVRFKLDYRGSEIKWDIKNSAGTLIGAGGPYKDGNFDEITVPVSVPANDCYAFTVYDSLGNGLWEPGWFQLVSPSGQTIYEGGRFGLVDFVEWKTDGEKSGISVSPNPNSGDFQVDLGDSHPHGAHLTIWSADGKQVYRKGTAEQYVDVSLPNCAPGVYFVVVSSEEGVFVTKMLLR